jgi:hypothetical protein
MEGQNQKQAADYERQRQAKLDAQNEALAQSQIAKTTQDIAASKAQVSREDLDSAANRIHQAAADALAKAEYEYSKTHDAAVLKQNQQRIDQDYKLGLAQIKQSKDNAQLQASTSRAIANIQAATSRANTAAEVGAQIRGQDVSAATAAANRAQEASEFQTSTATTRRGQDIGFKEYSEGYRGSHANPTFPQESAAINRAENTLKGLGLTPPDDPVMDNLLMQFADPANRQAMLADPKMPPEYKTYLTKLSGLLPPVPNTPTPRPTP